MRPPKLSLTSRPTLIIAACVVIAAATGAVYLASRSSDGTSKRLAGDPATSAVPSSGVTPTGSAPLPSPLPSAASPSPSPSGLRAGSTARSGAPSRSPAAGSSGANRSTPAPTGSTGRPPEAPTSAPPSRNGYFSLAAVGTWSTLPGDATCAARVRRSTWEPRRDNAVPNHTMPNAAAVHQSFRARPVSGGGSADPRWDSWLLQRVDGQYTGTTDEIFQWAACKWGLPDNLLRAVAVRESTWYEYEIYPSGRPVLDWGMGDMMPKGTAGASTYCDGLAGYGRDYQQDFGAGVCPQTFSIAGVMSWQSPSWGAMPGNQNGTFPFNRQSTAFALDYLASQLRGCYNGWQYFLKDSGSYRAGDIWGCVGAWYAGDWHSSDADGYIGRVRTELDNRTWLRADWPANRPACSPTYGCPIGSR